MRLVLLASIISILGAACAGRSPKDEHARLAVVRSVGFAAESGASSEIRNDCRMGEELIEGIGEETHRHITVRLVGDHKGVPGRVLAMRFARVDDEPGYKVVSLMGRLLEDGKSVAWFTAQRSTQKSGEICELMGDIVDDLAGDVAEWLRDPGSDATLGEL